ncbi:circadian clock KaiB family protein [Dyadobacter arcticus]|uniref:Circadian clock protein KaiB n=1 Tax=Dyadobacter arcticus TaxID=1078754 RepID=A0ABX0URR9_9BACT|nr:circadian clock KaiB family protein [Dyadobacter arcticus]NIJ54420.1 circadian clock protein KaiB [Dyadobacter arcticus]
MNSETQPQSDEEEERYVLRLFIIGASLNSMRAVANLKEICEKYIKDNYSLEIVDVHQEKSIAAKEQLIALPMLIKLSPSPERRLIGDMSDTPKVLKGLGISQM